MNRDLATEQWLDKRHVPYRSETIRLADIDLETSLKNQARLSQPLDKDRVEEMTLAMRETKALFPPIVVYQNVGTKKWVIITGNHRVHAAIDAGWSEFDAYVVTSQDKMVLDVLTRTINQI